MSWAYPPSIIMNRILDIVAGVTGNVSTQVLVLHINKEFSDIYV